LFPRLLVPAFVIHLATPQSARGTGIESPQRWIEQTEKPRILETPEFYFELEVKRIAAELYPAKAPTAGSPSNKDQEDPDIAEYRDALQTKRINPPDPAKAQEANDQTHGIILHVKETGGAAPDGPLPQEFPSELAEYHRGALAFHLGKKEEAKEIWTALLARPKEERHYRTTWAMYMLGKLATDDQDFETAKSWYQRTREAAKQGFADSLDLVTESYGWEAYGSLYGSENYAEAADLYLK
jgi:hypothetical protein